MEEDTIELLDILEVQILLQEVQQQIEILMDILDLLLLAEAILAIQDLHPLAEVTLVILDHLLLTEATLAILDRLPAEVAVLSQDLAEVAPDLLAVVALEVVALEAVEEVDKNTKACLLKVCKPFSNYTTT